jgi:hypothetical protein
MANGKNISTRSFLSIGSALAFVALIFSGIALYTAPPCSVANSIGWSFLFMGKEAWEAVHIVFALAFIILASLHLWYNWGPFAGYFSRKPREGKPVSHSVIIAAIAAVALFLLAAFDLPPVSWLHQAHESIKFSWSRNDGYGQGKGRGMRGRGMGKQRGGSGNGFHQR